MRVSLEHMESGESTSSGGDQSGTFRQQESFGSSSLQPSFSYDTDSDKQYKRDLPWRLLAWRVSPAALSIFLSVGTSMLVFPFFTYVHTTGVLGERLPQVR